MRYKVNWKYQSNLGGPWAKGIEIDLEPKLAALINGDSPGVLTETKAVKEAPADKAIHAAAKDK